MSGFIILCTLDFLKLFIFFAIKSLLIKGVYKFYYDKSCVSIKKESCTNKNANILFLTTFSDDEYIIKALNLGARGYLLKQDFESIIPALKAAYSGQSVFGGQVISKLPNLMEKGVSDKEALSSENNDEQRDFPEDITKKEIEVMEQVAMGLNNKEIAANLYLSEGTVRNYISTILEKLNLRDRTQLAIYYLKR